MMPNVLSRLRSVRAVRPPSDSALARFYDEASFVDSFAIGLTAAGPHDIGDLAVRALGRSGPGLRAAMGLRDATVSLFGLKTTRAIRARMLAEGHDCIGFFPVKSRAEREIVLGEDDAHLDFRLSLSIQAAPDGTGEDLVGTTVVRCNNGLGRIYLAAIMPGHKIIARSVLSKAVTADRRH